VIASIVIAAVNKLTPASLLEFLVIMDTTPQEAFHWSGPATRAQLFIA
jgi:hypothetical protein